MEHSLMETNGMARLLKLEELGQFSLSIILFNQLDYAWWLFPALLLVPDVSMLGYLAGPKAGARLYNFFHHKAVAVILFAFGSLLDTSLLTLSGIILFGHSAMDRIFGYGLKYPDGFRDTHLGWIGKKS